jgi:predicted MPP superfamily phosphohydrolase
MLDQTSDHDPPDQGGPDAAPDAPARPDAPAAPDAPDAPARPAVLRRLWRRRAITRILRLFGVLAVVLAGSGIGAALAPPVTTQVGPLEAQVRVRPSLNPGVHLLLPPAGEVTFATHWSPVAVEASVSQVDLVGARTLIESPVALRGLQRTAPDDLRRATLRAAVLTTLCAVAGALGLAVLVYRTRWRRIAQTGLVVTGLLAGVGGLTVAGFDSDSFAQPRFSGLLSQAPYVAGAAGGVMQRLENYRTGVADLVQGITTLYGMSGRLPVVRQGGSGTGDVVTVLHVSDLHLNPLGFDLVENLVTEFKVDLVVDTGDITTWGTELESSTLGRIGRLKVPYVFVRGNHDSSRTQAAVAASPNAVVLDGSVAIVDGLVIAGIGDPVFTPRGAAPSASAATPSPGVPVLRPADPQVEAGTQLARVIAQWNAAHPDQPVDIAAVHEPYAVPPLLGTVPLVLDGHFHDRDVKLDASGTRVMRQGSTGGAGISADFQAIEDGAPLPLEATLLYVARGGDRAGDVVAYDEVTVGGFGLASASVNRTVVRPTPTPTPTPSP